MVIKEFKTCTKCGKTKTLDNFYSTKKYSNIKGEYTYYLPSCKECVKKQGREYRIENEESYRKVLKKYQESEKGKKKHRERSRKRLREGKHKEWQQKNPEKVKRYIVYRVMNKQHEITESEWNDCKQYFDFKCAYCGLKEEEAKEKYNNKLHKDHADHNGSNDLSNCIPACKSCNGKKHNFDLEEWYRNDDNFTQQRLDKINKWLQDDHKLFIEKKISR